MIVSPTAPQSPPAGLQGSCQALVPLEEDCLPFPTPRFLPWLPVSWALTWQVSAGSCITFGCPASEPRLVYLWNFPPKILDGCQSLPPMRNTRVPASCLPAFLPLHVALGLGSAQCPRLRVRSWNKETESVESSSWAGQDCGAAAASLQQARGSEQGSPDSLLVAVLSPQV